MQSLGQWWGTTLKCDGANERVEEAKEVKDKVSRIAHAAGEKTRRLTKL